MNVDGLGGQDVLVDIVHVAIVGRIVGIAMCHISTLALVLCQQTLAVADGESTRYLAYDIA